MPRLNAMRSLAAAGHYALFTSPRTIVAGISRRSYAKRRIRQLERLDSGILTDIGLSRADITVISVGEEDEIHPGALRLSNEAR
jgi:uncharacterized protein YjiS (DUF1127 family)